MKKLAIADQQAHRAASALKKALCHRFGDRIEKVVLFGSHAREEAEETSDVDLVCVVRAECLDPGKWILRTLDDVARVSLQYDRVLSVLFADHHTFFSSPLPFWRQVRKEGIEI